MARYPTLVSFDIGSLGELQHHCGHCKVSELKLLRCVGCNIIRYCCRDHQVADRAKHKTICRQITKARTKLSAEENLVKNATPDFMTPANAFETNVGHFWGIVSTRNYMLARVNLATLLRKTGTLGGTQESLSHMLDMLRLCRSDNLGLRDTTPTLMIQLDQDQESYDFVKWWLDASRRSDYDWGDTELPYLDIKNADVLEGVKFTESKYSNKSHIAAILLIVIKMLIDMHNINTVRRIKTKSGKLPNELATAIEIAVIRSPLSVPWCDQGRETVINESTQRMSQLETQIEKLGRYVHHANPYCWKMVLEPGNNMNEIPESYSAGSLEEAQVLMYHTYLGWYQTEGVIPAMKRALAMSGSSKGMCTMWSNFGKALVV